MRSLQKKLVQTGIHPFILKVSSELVPHTHTHAHTEQALTQNELSL